MATQKKAAYIKLPGSKKTKPIGTEVSTDRNQTMEVTVRVRRKASIESHLNSGKQYSREEYEKMFGMADDDINKVEDFANEYHLSIAQVQKGRRSIILKGKVSDLNKPLRLN